MKLAYRLFGSHLAVVLIGLFLMIAVTAYLAPRDFSERMQHNGMGAMMGRGQTVLQEVETEYRQTLYQALFVSSAVGISLAVLMSWWLSQRIVKPIRLLVQGSQKIADGHYAERLDSHSRDELGELIQSFNRMAESLASTEALRRELLADVSHELKTPLASIKAYMEGLQDGVIPASAENFEIIHREASRMQRLVTDLQELSKTEAQALSLNLQPVKLNELLQRLIARFAAQYAEKQIQIQFSPLKEKLLVKADADRLEQVFSNVLGNALQYTPENGLVRIDVEKQADLFRIGIHDNGIGLSEVEQKRIFQRFYRVDKSRARASGGSGIGLTIAKSLIEAQGGCIWAESGGLGKGSSFYIEIPQA